MRTMKSLDADRKSTTLKICPIICLAISLLAYSGSAAAAPSLQEQLAKIKHEELMLTTSKDAFSAVESILLKLQIGTAVKSSGLTWSIREINDERGKVIGLNASSNGWLGPLSGGVLGAGYQFGSFIGRSGAVVYGEHVYGYTWMNVNIVPCYIVTTEADSISEKEFEELKHNKTSPVGWFWVPGGDKEKIFFKNVRIRKVQKTAFKDSSSISAALGDPITSKGYLASHLTGSVFNAAANKITQLKPGMSVAEVIQSLDGKLILFPPNDTLIIYGINGFLNYKRQYRFEQLSADGYFSVWPFGFVDGDIETPKLAVIFRNGEVLKVVPYTFQEELKSFFH